MQSSRPQAISRLAHLADDESALVFQQMPEVEIVPARGMTPRQEKEAVDRGTLEARYFEDCVMQPWQSAGMTKCDDARYCRRKHSDLERGQQKHRPGIQRATAEVQRVIVDRTPPLHEVKARRHE